MICARNVFFSYDPNRAVVKNLTMELQPGSITCLMGPSGSGKTTILRLFTGKLSPDKGKMEGINDTKISIVFQEDRLLLEYTVAENICLFCQRGILKKNGTIEKKAFKQIIREHLDYVGLLGFEDTKVKDLSGGMKRRVSIVCAMLATSDVVIMDEPFAGIDLEQKKRVIQYIQKFLQGRAFLFVSHEEMDATSFRARVERLNK